MGDAQAFPLVASAGLFSLFLAFTFFKEYVSVILTVYAVVLGTGSTASMFLPAIEYILPEWFTKTEAKISLPNLPHIPVINPAPEKGEDVPVEGARAACACFRRTPCPRLD